MSKLFLLNSLLASPKRAAGVFSAALALALPLASATQAQAQVAAKSADSFVESIGVNTHFEYGTYSNYTGLKQKLAESGIRYVRDGSHPNSLAKLGELYISHGIRTNMLLGRRFAGPWAQPLDLSQIGAELADVKKLPSGAVVSLEAPNEYDIMHGDKETDWVGKVQQYTKDTYAKAKADATLKNLPLLGPSLTSGSAYSQVGNMDPWIDYANLHPYQSDRHPGSTGWGGDGYGSINWHKKYGSIVQSPSGKPTQATECGYHNDPANDGVSEEAAGKYTSRMYAEFFRTGFSVRSFKYELLNQDVVGSYKEGVFGLLRKDLTEKPSFRAVKNMISVLSDKGAAFTPGSLNYTLTGSTNNVRQQLFQKRNGDWFLMLWLEVPSWDVNNNTNLYPAAQGVTLTVPSTITAATKYELNNNSDMSTAAVAISGNALSLSVSDKIMIVKLAAGTTPPPVTGTFSGIYKLTARHSGKALDVSGVSTANGAAVHQWDYVGGANQQWKVELTSTGNYTLTAQHSGKVLDANGTADGVACQQQPADGSGSQRWRIEATSDGYYKLTNQTSGKVLDVFNASTSNGALVKQYGYGGGLNQQWRLELVSAARTTDPSVAATATAEPAASLVVSLSAFPNPSTGPATLALEAAEAQRVTVYVHNQQGTLVSLLTVPVQAGHTDFRLPTDLSTGTYFLRALIDGQKQQFVLKVAQ